MRLVQERDYQEQALEGSLRHLRIEANQQNRETNRALDRLNILQSELEQKTRENEASKS